MSHIPNNGYILYICIFVYMRHLFRFEVDVKITNLFLWILLKTGPTEILGVKCETHSPETASFYVHNL